MNYKGLSQKKLKKYTKERVDIIGLCDNLKDEHPEDYIFFINYLFTRHPNYPDKINGLDNVIIKKNPYGDLSVYFKTIKNEINDISALNKCITGKEKDNLYIAMRISILPQIVEYRNECCKVICEICKSYHDIEVDHEEPHFIDLMSDFINIEQYMPNKFASDKYHRKILTTEDNNFNKKWIKYHKINSKLRLLCKKCNSSREKHKRNIVISNVLKQN